MVTNILRIFKDQDQLLCCSDIIESIFGRYKNKGGMKAISADVLAIALYNTDLTPDLIKTAMTSVSEQDVARWKQNYVCGNRYSLIRRMDKELKNAGADSILINSPPYAVPNEMENAMHALKIDRAVNLPIMLYNYPHRTGTMMGAEYLDRVGRSPNFRAINESSGDLPQLHMLARK